MHKLSPRGGTESLLAIAQEMLINIEVQGFDRARSSTSLGLNKF